MQTSTGFETIQGFKMEVERRGSGQPLLLFLSEEAQIELNSPIVAELAAKHELIIPQAPGFGRSERPDWISSPDDIAYMYLDLVEKLGLKSVPIVGFSLGAWIAVEMAIKDDSFISKMALVDALGVKIGGPFDRDVQDIWTLHPSKVASLKWHEPEKAKRDYTAMPEEQVSIVARNVESFARFCWDPYMHNPKLKARLHRVKVPTLFIWGENDGMVTPTYGEAYSKLIAGARFVTVPNAGHYPQIEQPAAVLREIEAFIG